MSDPVLSVRDLAKAFGGLRAVDGVSFDVAAGDLVALIGPNGAGKSTCFNLINGQLAPDAGRGLVFLHRGALGIVLLDGLHELPVLHQTGEGFDDGAVRHGGLLGCGIFGRGAFEVNCRNPVD